ncbi:sumo domain-containing protein [Streptomyces sp. NPDC004111]|uniref:sumo domain-containing protein n=1 Tax=Streptomyces sp. NPDC004111 TaxID=3364690 RepID=UPI0036C41C7C
MAEIRLRVRDAGGEDSTFHLDTADPLQEVMHAFAERTDQPQGVLRFTYRGDRLLSTSTPHELGMQDDDLIEAATTSGE